MRLRAKRPPAAQPAADPEAAEDFFLEILKQRVGWQATLAATTRAGETLEPLTRGARPAHLPVAETERAEEVAVAVDELPPAAAPPPRATPWTMDELERIVREREAVDPEGARELSYYTFYPRNFAAPDGTLPDYFDRLLDEFFAAPLRS
jgi:hypothetical protein